MAQPVQALNLEHCEFSLTVQHINLMCIVMLNSYNHVSNSASSSGSGLSFGSLAQQGQAGSGFGQQGSSTGFGGANSGQGYKVHA